MEASGWRLTPRFGLNADERHGLDDLTTSSASAFSSAAIAVSAGQRFFLQIERDGTDSGGGDAIEGGQFELELSAGGGRVARVGVDCGSDQKKLDVWLDGSGELGNLARNSKGASVGAKGVWEWIDFEDGEEDDDPLSLKANEAAAPNPISGGLVLRIFRRAGKGVDATGTPAREGGSSDGGGGKDDRDARQILRDYLAQADEGQQEHAFVDVGGRKVERKVQVDLTLKPPIPFSKSAPPPSHSLLPLRSPHKSIKPAVATFVIGYRLEIFRSPSSPAQRKAIGGHPTPPSSVSRWAATASMTPSGSAPGSATYSHKHKKRGRQPSMELDAVAAGGGSSSAGEGGSSQGAYRPVTPAPRGFSQTKGAPKVSSAVSKGSTSTEAADGGGANGPKDGSPQPAKKVKAAPPASASATSPSLPSSGQRGPQARLPAASPYRPRPLVVARMSAPPAASSSSSRQTAALPRSASAGMDDSDDPMSLAHGSKIGELEVIEIDSSPEAVRHLPAGTCNPPLPSPALAGDHGRRNTSPALTRQDASVEVDNEYLNLDDADLYEHENPGAGEELATSGELGAQDAEKAFVPAPDNLFSLAETAAKHPPPTTDVTVEAVPTSLTHVSSAASRRAAKDSRSQDKVSKALHARVGDAEAKGSEAHSPPVPMQPSPLRKPSTADAKAEDETAAAREDAHLSDLDHEIVQSVNISLNLTAKAFVQEYWRVDYGGIAALGVLDCEDLTARISALEDELMRVIRPAVVEKALTFLPLLDTADAPPADLSRNHRGLLDNLRRIVLNAMKRQQTMLFDSLRASLNPALDLSAQELVELSRPATILKMKDKVVRALQLEQKHL